MRRFAVVGVWVVALASVAAWGQEKGHPSGILGKKLCVADIANSSTKPVFTDELKEKTVGELQKLKVNAENSYSATMLGDHLDMSGRNLKVMERAHCDYMLLGEVALGKWSNRRDAKEGEAKPASEQVVWDYALFKKGSQKAIVEGTVVAAEGKPLTESFVAAASEVAGKVADPVLKKK